MTNQDRDLIAELLSEALDPSAPEVREAFAKDPELEREFLELAELEGLLRTDAGHEREVRGELPVDAPAAGQPGPMHSRFRWLAGAAAVLVALWTLPPLFQDPGPGRSPDPRVLGAKDLALTAISPQGPGSSFAKFEVKTPITSGQRTEVKVWSLEPGTDPLYSNATTHFVDARDGWSWEPSAALFAKLPESIRWEFRLINVEGTIEKIATDIRATK